MNLRKIEFTVTMGMIGMFSLPALAAELKTRNVPHAYRVIPGPHDQPWLREAGTIEAVHWLDRLYSPEK